VIRARAATIPVVMPHVTPPTPPRRPPSGVPRWLWPPPGATVRSVLVRERAPAGGESVFEVVEGEWPEALHLRALQWLLEDHVSAPRPGTEYEGRLVLEIARTEMAAGRVGHAYALNGGPLGAPGADDARGGLLRFTQFALRRG
jgi:hypothetical protein